ncbi:uncharacterized protein LOC129793453 isoform X4 [Lutzomyia longipalpis]|uniref:uncharacterized protein LOC129793453 isoform X4 n=1 Tax=Lutzomyia longipalpis TaxID=7200 RepID=UPI002484589E|nr:uncharacterized protein LOC129793453 isoform X4 [Lutzomyia longipalpis]
MLYIWAHRGWKVLGCSLVRSAADAENTHFFFPFGSAVLSLFEAGFDDCRAPTSPKPNEREINPDRQNSSFSSCGKASSPMGKCISRVTTGKSHHSFGSTQHLAISEGSFDGSCIDEGQSESKKGGKKERGNGTVETKGTAMSFGFRKKSTLAGKKNGNAGTKEKEKIQPDAEVTVIGNRGVLKSNLIENDKNGNSGSTNSLDEAVQTGRSTPRLSAPKKEMAGTNYRSNRFGFRQSNVVRPASTGLTPKIADFDSNPNNNAIADKRRSKSASAQRSSTTQINEMHQKVTNQQDPKIAAAAIHQHQQNLRAAFFEPQPKTTTVRTAFHTNDIVRPSPQLAVTPSVTKLTLHTAQLPRPQVPVPISLNNTRPMDPKGAKQALNNSRRSFFAGTTSRDTSLDSGISSYASSQATSAGRKARVRQRNLEVIMNGRHTFQVRDLDDSLSDETIVPLVLPKLPSAFQASRQPAPINGLIRIDQPNYREFHRDHGSPPRKPSIPSDVESLEEDGEEGKLFRDKAASEKKLSQIEAIKDFSPSSKQSSPGSSRASWGHAGESMAHKDFSSLSLSSSDDSKEPQRVSSIVIRDDDITSITFTLDQPHTLSSAADYLPPYRLGRDANPREESLALREDTQFAEMAAAVSDVLLDDETSPTDSLVSSCTDTDELMKKSVNKRKSLEGMHISKEMEKDIDEISPELDDINLISPVMIGTPTHASNSLSLSEAGRDFLIDDEIADQPALVFTDKNETTSNMQVSTADTVTLQEVNSTENLGDLAASMTQSGQRIFTNGPPQQAPKAPRRLQRSESLDTLSPCESIASDDLMIDYQSQSSLDSVEKIQSNGSGGSGSALHSMDENQLWSELEAQGGELLREWSSLLRVNGSKPGTRDSITSQLPARATRLLNRSRLQSTISTAGSDSPRSLDGVPRRAQSLSKTNSPQFFRESNTCSPDSIYMDKSTRNAMIQDIAYFKKQLLRLKCLLQEGDPLNSFEHNNGQIFNSCAPDSNLGSLSSLQSESTSNEDPRKEMAELRRQTELDDRDRTIKIQKNIIAKYEAEKLKNKNQTNTMETATQTERVKPIAALAQDQISRIDANGVSQSPQRCITTTTSISFKSPSKTASVKPVKATPIGNVTNIANSQKYVRSFSVDDALSAGKCGAKNGKISAGPISLPMINGSRKIPILSTVPKNPPARIPRSSLSSSRSDSVNSSSSSLSESTDRKSLPAKLLTTVAK